MTALRTFVLNRRIARAKALKNCHNGFDVSCIELFDTARSPIFCFAGGRAIDDLSHGGQMLAGMVEIDDLRSAGKVFIRYIPDPCRAISQNNNASSPLQASAYCFGVDARTKFLGRFDRSDIGGGLVIALRPALIIEAGLGEDASQLHFTCFRPSRFILTFATFGFAGHDGDTGSINGDVERGDGLHALQLSR